MRQRGSGDQQIVRTNDGPRRTKERREPCMRSRTKQVESHDRNMCEQTFDEGLATRALRFGLRTMDTDEQF